MSDIAFDRRADSDRIYFQEEIQLLPTGSYKKAKAHAINLSETGMFVSSCDVYPVGTELLCEVSHQTLAGELLLRGEVMWIANHNSPGMGIRFIDLSDVERAVLGEIVSLGTPLGWSRKVKIWFEETKQPIRAEAIPLSQGVLLDSSLPFLRCPSQVMLTFNDEGETYDGILEEVSIKTTVGEPHLQLHVSLIKDIPAQSSAADPSYLTGSDTCAPSDCMTWTHWPPPPLPPEEVHEIAEHEIAEHEIAEHEIAEHEIVIEASPESTDDIVFPLTTTSKTFSAAGTIDVENDVENLSASAPPTTQDQSQSVESDLLADGGTTNEDRVQFHESASSQWDLELPTLHESQWRLLSEENAAASHLRRRSVTWLWLAALVMVGLTLASMVHTNLWTRIVDRVESWTHVLGNSSMKTSVSRSEKPHTKQTVSIDPAPAPILPAKKTQSTSSSALPPKPSLSMSTREKQTKGERKRKAAEDEGQKPVRKENAPSLLQTGTPQQPTNTTSQIPYLTVKENSHILTVPIRGSTEAAVHYPLANPDGLAINLPHGTLAASIGDYPLNKGGVRLVWLRQRQAGIHLRVFFTDGLPTYSIKIAGQSIQIILPSSED